MQTQFMQAKARYQMKFIALFCRLSKYGYILRSKTVENTLRLDSYGRDGSVFGVIRATSISITD